MSIDMNDNKPADQTGRPQQRRFASPPQTGIPDENFTASEPYETYGTKQKKQKKHTSRKAFVVLLIIVVLAGIGAAAYYLFLKPKAVTKAPVHASQSSQSSGDNSAKTTATAATKHYDSTNFSLGIDYPTSWTLADTDSSKMTLKSPLESLPGANGQSTSGKIVFMIQNKQTSIPDFAKGSATAVLDSDKVAYTKPTSNQRANTYLSYLQYAATTTNGALDGIYITGDNGYQKGQDVPQADIIGVDPLVTVTFVSCADSACAVPKPISLQSSSWQKSVLAAPVKAALQSLSFN
jgi:cytoskeletal protein RodZ